jgi:hypothetical protein
MVERNSIYFGINWRLSISTFGIGVIVQYSNCTNRNKPALLANTLILINDYLSYFRTSHLIGFLVHDSDEIWSPSQTTTSRYLPTTPDPKVVILYEGRYHLQMNVWISKPQSLIVRLKSINQLYLIRFTQNSMSTDVRVPLQIELEFRNVDFRGGRKTGEPGVKPSKQGRESI